MRTALTIAGSDSGGGAGIQADLKTFAAHGVYGTSALTAITAQNTLGVVAWEAVSTPLVVQQIEAVLGDIGADAIKIGMLANAAIVNAVARTLASRPSVPIVVDPVMIAKGGDRLLETAAVAALKAELLPLAHIVTPNIPEAEVLAGCRSARSTTCALAGDRIRRLGPRVVLVKGGHAGAASRSTSRARRREVSRSAGRACRAGIRTARVARCRRPSPRTWRMGMDDEAAIRAARDYLEGAIRHAPQLGGGHGPLNHGWRQPSG